MKRYEEVQRVKLGGYVRRLSRRYVNPTSVEPTDLNQTSNQGTQHGIIPERNSLLSKDCWGFGAPIAEWPQKGKLVRRLREPRVGGDEVAIASSLPKR